MCTICFRNTLALFSEYMNIYFVYKIFLAMRRKFCCVYTKNYMEILELFFYFFKLFKQDYELVILFNKKKNLNKKVKK